MLSVNALLGLWQVYRARKLSIRRLRPFVDRTRWHMGEDFDDLWGSPYRVGFLTTLITLAARRASIHIDPDGLGLVQLDVWAELTQMSPDLIGERIMSLSLNQDVDFINGCRSAMTFDEALSGSQAARFDPADDFDLAIDTGLSSILHPEGGESQGERSRDPIFSLWDRLLSAG
jgi:hypothetical protein